MNPRRTVARQVLRLRRPRPSNSRKTTFTGPAALRPRGLVFLRLAACWSRHGCECGPRLGFGDLVGPLGGAQSFVESRQSRRRRGKLSPDRFVEDLSFRAALGERRSGLYPTFTGFGGRARGAQPCKLLSERVERDLLPGRARRQLRIPVRQVANGDDRQLYRASRRGDSDLGSLGRQRAKFDA